MTDIRSEAGRPPVAAQIQAPARLLMRHDARSTVGKNDQNTARAPCIVHNESSTTTAEAAHNSAAAAAAAAAAASRIRSGGVISGDRN